MCNKDLRRKENQSEDGIIKGSPTIREKLSSKNLASKKYLPSSPSERYDTKHPIIEWRGNVIEDSPTEASPETMIPPDYSQ